MIYQDTPGGDENRVLLLEQGKATSYAFVQLFKLTAYTKIAKWKITHKSCLFDLRNDSSSGDGWWQARFAFSKIQGQKFYIYTFCSIS